MAKKKAGDGNYSVTYTPPTPKLKRKPPTKPPRLPPPPAPEPTPPLPVPKLKRKLKPISKQPPAPQPPAPQPPTKRPWWKPSPRPPPPRAPPDDYIPKKINKLRLLLASPIIGNKLRDYEFKTTRIEPDNKYKKLLTNIMSFADFDEGKIDGDITNDEIEYILKYVLLNGNGTKPDPKNEDFIVVKKNESNIPIPSYFAKMDSDYELEGTNIEIYFKNKCRNGLWQFSGTCYFNTAINGIFLSNNIHKFLKHRLIDYYRSLDESAKTAFKQMGMTCLTKSGVMSEEIIYNLIKHYLCMKDNEFKDIKRNQITQIAKSILKKDEVNKGGNPMVVITNFFDILFPINRDDYVQILFHPTVIPKAPVGYILDHVGITMISSNSQWVHAVVGTFCYEDNVPIIVDSNFPNNPVYIDWRNPKSKEIIARYYETVYYDIGGEKYVFRIQYSYSCYVNKEKLEESKKFIIKSRNQDILNICTAYTKTGGGNEGWKKKIH